MAEKLGISTSKGYNDKFAEVSSSDFGIGTIIISDWDFTTLGTQYPKILTKKELTFYLTDDATANFTVKEPQKEHIAISGIWVYLGSLDGKHLWQKVVS